MRILLTGGSGNLGSAICDHIGDEHHVFCPQRNDMDITRLDDIMRQITANKVDVIIHAAAMTDAEEGEYNRMELLQTNIFGTVNVAIAALRSRIRVVYISTDYVYPGSVGHYHEDSPLLPVNRYAWSKLGGECAIMMVPNHLIIRTGFFYPGKYKVAYTDAYTSRSHVQDIAYMVVQMALSPVVGIMNIGRHRESIYDALKSDGVIAGNKNAFTVADCSMDTSRFLQWVSAPPAKYTSGCRICGNKDRLMRVLSLGSMPLTNRLYNTMEEAIKAERYPLDVMFCNRCMLLQLSVDIDSRLLFSDYSYHSSVNNGYVQHCKDMAIWYRDRYKTREDFFIIDIAGNDGALLQQFMKQHPQCKVLNVDPAENVVQACRCKGIPAHVSFWGSGVIPEEKADIITATNVLAHTINIHGFIRDVRLALKDEGLFVCEFPWVVNTLEQNQWDTVYFEHIFYLGITPLLDLFRLYDMRITDISLHPIHGGSIRIVACKDGSKYREYGNLKEYIDRERQCINKYLRAWQKRVDDDIYYTRMKIREISSKYGNSISAFGASAKGCVRLNASAIDARAIKYIIDETPYKQGKYMAGTGIPIVPIDAIMKSPTDSVVVLSWNFYTEMEERLRSYGYAGNIVNIIS